jgi:hypothetical protein
MLRSTLPGPSFPVEGEWARNASQHRRQLRRIPRLPGLVALNANLVSIN